MGGAAACNEAVARLSGKREAAAGGDWAFRRLHGAGAERARCVGGTAPNAQSPNFGLIPVALALLKMDSMSLRVFFLVPLLAMLAGCACPGYSYRYVPGKTAQKVGCCVVAPPSAPPQVQAAIAAGNRIAGLPYCYGAGHGTGEDTAYDCSGAASYVLRNAGVMPDVRTSGEFRAYGQPGPGEWITVWAKRGHVFMSVAGLRFDTGWTRGPKGPQWTMCDRPADGCVMRHPAGL